MMKAQRKNPDFLLLNIFCQPSRALPYTQRLSRMNFGLVNLQTSPSAAGPGGFILCNFATVGLSLQMKELEMWEKVSRRAGRPRWAAGRAECPAQRNQRQVNHGVTARG